MASPPVSELTERARAIFRMVVEGYLESGVPVGSKTLAVEGGINLREERLDLETKPYPKDPSPLALRTPLEIVNVPAAFVPEKPEPMPYV